MFQLPDALRAREARYPSRAQAALAPIFFARDGTAAAHYQPRRSEDSLLRRVVAEHLEEFLAQARAQHDKPLPAYVEKELRAFVECGVPGSGFALAQCPRCGRKMAVPFSCKRRGACGSCIARRMCNAAAHMVDHVFPEVAVRQYVLSVPFELRLLLARDATVYGAVTRIFAEEVMRSQRTRARERGVACAMSAGVSVQQRWGSSVNLNPHVHAAWCDGVFMKEAADSEDGTAAAARFHPLPAPTPEELLSIVLHVHERTVRWLGRRGLLADPEIAAWSNLAEERSSLDACLASALGVGQLGRADARQIAEGMPAPESDTDEERFERLRRGSLVADALGWSLHAGTTVAAWDRVGLETLLRYFTRPPLAQRRLYLLRDGRVAYALRKPWRRDQTHRIMTPLELIARLAAIIPAPRRPLLRFHGAFAPHSRWRRSVVPSSPPCPRTPPWQCATNEVSPRSGEGDPPARHAGEAGRAGSPSPTGNLAVPATRSEPARPRDGTRTASLSMPASSAEWRDRPRLSRIDWATLLWRVHDVDALACECGARLRFIDLFADPVRAQAELEALGLGGPDTPRPDAAGPSSRARDPTAQDDVLDWP